MLILCCCCVTCYKIYILLFSHGDITVYLLYTTSFITLEEVKNYKSLQSYKYFTAGWVVQIRWKAYTDCCLVVGKVNHSYSVSSTPLRPWLILRSSGAVVCGHCVCMAGLGETCSHVGALLYWLEYTVRKREEISCTSGVNQWIEPKCTKQIPYLELVNIDFTSAERTMKEGGASAISESVKSRASAVPNPPEEDIKRLFDKCLTSENTPVLFSVECQPYCDAFIQSAAHLPLALQSLYDPANLQLNYMELVEAGESLQGILDISPAQQRHLETITRDQAKSHLWMKYRAGRITASRLFQAVHTDPNKPAISLVSAICYPESVKFTSSATKYGCEHERKAIDAYKLKQQQDHQQLKVTPAGLVLYLTKSCFGASPDSFLECLCCGSGVLEVKCPYCLRDTDIRNCPIKNICQVFTRLSRLFSSFCKAYKIFPQYMTRTPC